MIVTPNISDESRILDIRPRKPLTHGLALSLYVLNAVVQLLSDLLWPQYLHCHGIAYIFTEHNISKRNLNSCNCKILTKPLNVGYSKQ